MPTLEVYLLGPLEIRYQKQALPTPPTRKSQALLAYLLLHRDQPQPRERLAGLCWGDRPERQARRSLTTALWHIRRGLPDKNLLCSDAQTAQFDPQADLWLDTEAFATGTTHDDLAHLEAAAALYRGDFLAGLDDDWIVEERYRLQALYEQLLAKLTAGHEATGDYPDTLAAAQRLLAHNPLREAAHRAAMRAYCQLGQRNAALEQYRRCQEILQAELAVDPADETTALYQAIREERCAAGAAPRGQPAAAPLPPSDPRLATSPLDIVAAAPFVGRQEELAALQSHWQRAQAGDGRLILISGEAGVGKTRLVAELTGQLRWQGARVLTGRCYEFERTLPYQPLAEALRGLLPVLTPDRQAGLPRRVLGEVARLVPELGERDPELVPAVVGRSGQEQARLFDGLARFLDHWAAAEALFLLLEDLHWAGESTLQLLHYLARHLAGQPVLLVGTFRPEEVGPRHPLQELRRQLDRESPAYLHALAPLSAEAVAALLGEMSAVGAAVQPLARRLYQETAGNPFFLMEAIKACFELEWIQLEAGTWQGDFDHLSRIDLPLPRGVIDVIQARVGRLSPESQSAVQLAAVLGREFDYEPLAAAWDRGEEATLQALDELLRRRLVEEGTGAMGRDYAFVHHKIQEAVYAGIPQRHRRHLHKRVGAALEQLHGDAVAGALAHHFLQGRPADPDLTAKAIRYLLRAGDQERLAYAHREASAHYEQAITLLKEQGQYQQAARTLMKLGLTYHTALDFTHSDQAYDEGFALWQQSGAAQTTALLPPAAHPLRLDWIRLNYLGPSRAYSWEDAYVIAQLFSGLVAWGSELDIVPDVAHSWQVQEQGRKYLFYLREEARWSDGTPLTAEDFIFAWQQGTAWGTRRPLLEQLPEINRVYAADRHTVVVELQRPLARLLYLLPLLSGYPLPRHAIQSHGEAWIEPGHMVSNGPFVVEAWDRKHKLVCARNPFYHGPYQGNVQRVELSLFTTSDWATRLARYEEDRLDVQHLWMLPFLEADHARQRHAGEYLTGPWLATICMWYDVSRPPFADVRVRRALIMAVDRNLLANVRLRGYFSAATDGFLPPGMPGYTPGIGLPFDPAAARRLLAAAGYPSGRGIPPIDLTTWAFPGNEVLCAFLQEQWQEHLGVEVTWESLKGGEVEEKWSRQPPHIFPSYVIAFYPDPSSMLRKRPLPDRSHWYNRTYEQLLAQAERALDPERRLDLYRQADRLLIEEAVCIPLAYFRSHLLVKPWVRHYPTSAVQVMNWKDVILEPPD